MFISHTMPTAFGYSLSSEPRGTAIPSTPAAALAFASMMDRRADVMLAEGRCQQAERLSHLALEARCRATGERA